MSTKSGSQVFTGVELQTIFLKCYGVTYSMKNTLYTFKNLYWT